MDTNLIYPDCREKDYDTGEPYYKHHKKPQKSEFNPEEHGFETID